MKNRLPLPRLEFSSDAADRATTTLLPAALCIAAVCLSLLFPSSIAHMERWLSDRDPIGSSEPGVELSYSNKDLMSSDPNRNAQLVGHLQAAYETYCTDESDLARDHQAAGLSSSKYTTSAAGMHEQSEREIVHIYNLIASATEPGSLTRAGLPSSLRAR